jgi:SWI/SNF-related matrix-associated actin-dependent regulator of chromatin subfamily A3
MSLLTQILQRHLVPGTVKVYKYHGQNKRVDYPTVLSHDIILATYATVANDFGRGRSMLNAVNWYKIVLDEGKAR